MFKLASSHVYNPLHRKKKTAPPSARSTGKAEVAVEEVVDSNVISLSLGPLLSDTVLATGDPVHCSQCTAVLTKDAKLVALDGPASADTDGLVWNCEYCGQRNVVNVEPEEIPQSESVEYLLSPATAVEEAGPAASTASGPSIIFCIDTSGSMCVSYEMDSKLKLRGSEKREEELRKLNTENTPQRLRGEKAAVTYVTRLQLVQAAVDAQLKNLHDHHGDARVGIVTFSDDVVVIGDGSEAPRTIAGDKLSDYDSLIKESTELHLNRSVRESKAMLSERLFGLEENGGTALGPALVTSIGMAGTHPGSRVIICTDGLANIGVGSLDGAGPTLAQNEAFYERVGAWARDRGVAVSIVTIEGTECKIEHLGGVADMTGGDTDRVKPLALDFSSLLANPIIATNVTATVLLHHALHFKKEDNVLLRGAPAVVRDVSSATTESEITFEFGVNTEVLGDVKEIPFQIQIFFTKLNGMRCLRVLNHVKPVTTDRAVADAHVDIELMGVNVAQQSARLAHMGRYDDARENAMFNAIYMDSAVSSPEQARMVERYKSTMGRAVGHVDRLTALEEDGEEASVADRRARRDDDSANMIYQLKSSNAVQAKQACLVM